MNTREKQAARCTLLQARMVRQVANLAREIREIHDDECPELRLRTAGLWVAELAYSCECLARELGAPPLILSDRAELPLRDRDPRRALDLIAAVLIDTPEWHAGTIEDVADVITGSGYVIPDPNEEARP